MPLHYTEPPRSPHGLHRSTIVFLVLVASLGALTLGGRLADRESDPPVPTVDAGVPDHSTLAFQGEPGRRDRATTDASSNRQDPPTVSADAIFAIDAATDEEVYAAHADEPRDIGSTTKIVTALVTRAHADLDAKVTVVESDLVDPMIYSNMGLQAGDTLTVRQLLEGLLVPSGSDGANALARHVGGLIDPSSDDPESVFVDAMNEMAAELGMTNSVFANPHGNDAEGAHSSARDLATAARALLGDPVLAEIVAMPGYSFTSVGPEAREYHAESTNKLLTGGDAGVLGVKSGSTENAGGCLVLAFDRGDGQTIILVTLGSDLEYEGDWISVDARWDEARTLMTWLRESAP